MAELEGEGEEEEEQEAEDPAEDSKSIVISLLIYLEHSPEIK